MWVGRVRRECTTIRNERPWGLACAGACAPPAQGPWFFLILQPTTGRFAALAIHCHSFHLVKIASYSNRKLASGAPPGLHRFDGCSMCVYIST